MPESIIVGANGIEIRQDKIKKEKFEFYAKELSNHSENRTCYLYHEKSLMIKYSRMQKEIPSRLVCGSCVACLDCTLPGVQVTAGLGFFLHSGHLLT